MTLAMPDSTDVAALPDGYGQYLGYVDGDFKTAGDLRKRFPAARIVGLTVTGATMDADGCDIETGDLTEDEGARWAAAKLAVEPGSRPVLYASVSRMGTVRDRLVVHQVPRASVRLLSAHYGRGEHICGPGTCGETAVPMDGTQWTDTWLAPSGAWIDMSVLVDSFFGSWTEELVRELPVVRQGDSGDAVRTVQGALCARHRVVTIDGFFGPVTKTAIDHLQSDSMLYVDGVVGPQTWPVLLGIA